MNKKFTFFSGAVAGSTGVGAVLSAAVGIYLFGEGLADNCFGGGTTSCTPLEAMNLLVTPVLTVALAATSLIASLSPIVSNYFDASKGGNSYSNIV